MPRLHVVGHLLRARTGHGEAVNRARPSQAPREVAAPHAVVTPMTVTPYTCPVSAAQHLRLMYRGKVPALLIVSGQPQAHCHGGDQLQATT
jgi:hypothetical protein